MGGDSSLIGATEKDVGIFNDYRGVASLGTHAHISPEANWCLIAKIDVSEAVGNYSRDLFFVSLELIILLVAIFSFLGYLLAGVIIKPIRRLSEKINEITKGNLDVQLDKASSKEIQALTDSLNRILASMKLAILRSNLSASDMGLGEALEAKKEAEDKYKVIYDSSSDAIMTLEPPTWKFTSGNPSTVRLFHAKDEKEFTSFDPAKLSPKKQPDGSLSSAKAKKMIEKAMKEGKAYFDWVHRTLDGKDFAATVLLSKVTIGGKEILQATVRTKEEDKPKKVN
jgi:HAMP domain-containing protein